METLEIPKLSTTMIEEKRNVKKDRNSLSRYEVRDYFPAVNLEQALVAGFLIFAAVIFFLDHIAGRNLGTYGYNTTPPVDTRMTNK